MIVLDANILIRAVLGRRVRQLLESYAAGHLRFYAPEIAYADAEKYLPVLLSKRGRTDGDVPAALAYLRSLVEPISQEVYGLFEAEARAPSARPGRGGLACAGCGSVSLL